MTQLDDDLEPVATALLAEFGRDVTFEVSSSESYDEATGDVTRSTSLVVVKATPPAPYSQKLVDGDSIRKDDLQTFIAAETLTFTPLRAQKVTIGTDDYRIVEVRPISAGERTTMYGLQLRR